MNPSRAASPAWFAARSSRGRASTGWDLCARQLQRTWCLLRIREMLQNELQTRRKTQCMVQVRQACVLLISALVIQPYSRQTSAEVTTVSDASAAAGPMSPASSRFMMATDDKMVSGEYKNTTHDKVAIDTTK